MAKCIHTGTRESTHSVPFWRRMRNCSGLSTVLHSSSAFCTAAAGAVVDAAIALITTSLV
jgi:hypothetical protein